MRVCVLNKSLAKDQYMVPILGDGQPIADGNIWAAEGDHACWLVFSCQLRCQDKGDGDGV